MAHPKDLDEYTTEELTKELERRHRLNDDGRCDYCGRLSSEPTCRFSERHSAVPNLGRTYATDDEIDRVRNLHQDDEHEIDEPAEVSETEEGGVWVQGWFWLPDDDLDLDDSDVEEDE